MSEAPARLGRLLVASWLAALSPFWPGEAAQPRVTPILSELDMPMRVTDPDTDRSLGSSRAPALVYGYSQAAPRFMGLQQITLVTPAQAAQEHRLAADEARHDVIGQQRPEHGAIRSVDPSSQPIEEDRRRLIGVMIGALLVQALAIVLLLVLVRRQRRERERLVKALGIRDAELIRLGEVMAHHVQEPTRRLVSYTQRLRGQAALIADQDGRLALDFIQDQARRLSDLVRDLQRYLALGQAGVASGRVASEVALAAAIVALAPDPAVEITVRTPLPEVNYSEPWLREIYYILMDNALHYRKPEGLLRISVSAETAGGRAWFRFCDNGRGIPPEYREQVFELFGRLAPQSEAQPGTGLGLALLRKAVRLGGGEARIEEGMDGGTCILFDLPVETRA